jgi:hypothetical protein
MNQPQAASDRQFSDLGLVLTAEHAIICGIIPRIDAHLLATQDGSTRSLGRMTYKQLLTVIETAIRSGVFPEVNWKLDSTRRLGQLGWFEILLTVDNAVNLGILPGLDGRVEVAGQEDATSPPEQQPAQSRTDTEDANGEAEIDDGSTGDPVGTPPAHLDEGDLILLLEHSLFSWKARHEAMRKRYDELEDKHLNALCTVETLKSEVYELEREVGKAAEREQKLTTDLNQMRQQFSEMQKQRDVAIAELQRRKTRRARRADPAEGSSTEVGQPPYKEADELSPYPHSERTTYGHQTSTSQLVPRHMIPTNNSVLSMSSNRKVEMRPKSSFEHLRG